MIDIKLTEKYKLKNDEECFMLCVYSPSKKDPDYWKPVKFYTSMEAVLDALPGLLVRRDERVFTDLGALVGELRRWHDHLKNLLTGVVLPGKYSA